MTTSPNVLLYARSTAGGARWSSTAASCSARRSSWRGALRAEIDAHRRACTCWRTSCSREEASHDLDRLQVLIDVSELGISGYQAADWLREHERIDMGLSDHARILATLSIADDRRDAPSGCSQALRRLIDAAPGLPTPPPVGLPPRRSSSSRA